MHTIALVGYGKMGHEIERLAHQSDVEIVARYDIDKPLRTSAAAPFDTAIEFSTPATVVENISWLAQHNKQIVVGTTGWYDRLPQVRMIVEKAGVGLIYSSNFSIGMYLFARLVADAARAFHQFPEYDIALHEIHHRGKLDAPSGTALTLGETILRAWPGKTTIETDASGEGIAREALHVSSLRVGSNVGEHSVRIDSAADSITLTHQAHSRAGFAAGALRAVEWIAGKNGVFSMDDMMTDIVKTR